MIFVDSGYFVALLRPRDGLHARARQWATAVGREQLVTTEHVLIETGNSCRARTIRQRYHLLLDEAFSNPTYEVVVADHALLEAGLHVHRQYLDKEWSVTDCISFHVMREHRITRALTHDHHFEQAGFEALLRRDPP